MTDHPFSGDRLRHICAAARVNSTVLAARVGRTAETVEKYQCGGSTPRPAMVERLAAALGVEPEDFCDAPAGDDFDRAVEMFLGPLSIAQQARVLAYLEAPFRSPIAA